MYKNRFKGSYYEMGLAYGRMLKRAGFVPRFVQPGSVLKNAEAGGMRFCPDCGTPLETRQFEHRQRRFCPRCGQIQYRQLKVGAGALVEQEGRLLLLQRTGEPFKRCWNLPAGYAEADEDPTETAVRETREETGLQVEVDSLVDVYFFADDPRGNGILIVYKCHIVGGELTASSEGTRPTFLASEQIPAELAGGGHDQAILAWQKRAGTGRNVG